MKKIILILSVMLIAFAPCSARKHKSDTPKYIFLIIGDGLGINGISATENYLAYKEGLKYCGPRLAMRKLPVMGMCDTYSNNSTTTCSSAAATAIACGQKTNQGYEAVDTLGQPLESIATKLHNRGYNIGIVTNEPINHATPVAFYGHHNSRSYYSLFAKQLPESGFEVFAGDGFILDKKHKDWKSFDPIDYVSSNGYKICYGPEALRACPAGEKVCLFQPSSREANSKITAEADENKTYDIEEASKGDMTVQEMLELTVERLGDRKPFFIMCEGGDIDHAAHSSFTMSMINEIIELDKAVQSALEFYRKHPKETLIIVTSDHETGGMCLGGVVYGRGNWVNWKALEDDWNANKSRGFGEAELCRRLSADANIGWFATSHSGGNVPVFAIGKHAERFSNAMDNTQFIEKIL